jgi:alpha-beta hydrolase superfamily lysophospholipase
MNHFLLLALLALSSVLVSCNSLPKLASSPTLHNQDWTSFDGKIMPYQTWQLASGKAAHGIVIAVHGLSGATSDFWFIGDTLPNHGFIVYAYDLRGQGHDPVLSNRGDIQSSKQWLRDLETFHLLVKRKHPKLPIFWYGESLGSLICLHTAASRLPDHRDPDGIILASPVAGLKMTVSGFRRFLLGTAATLLPRSRYSLGDLAGIDEKKIQVTSTTNHGSQMAVTEHHLTSFSLRLLTEIGRLLDANFTAAKRLRMPVLFLASPNDILSSPDQVQELFSQVRSPAKRLLWYTRSYHLLLHDVQRAEVSVDLLKWLKIQCHR